jgi:sugar transferase (PEP-CTERM/EpsH1 system associated)
MPAHIADRRPLIAHIVFRLDYGGLENGVVNVINGLPEDAFRHAIIALTECTDFKARIRRKDVSVHALLKQPGKDPGLYLRLFRLLKSLRPAITHSRNLPTLEAAVVARLAGVPQRIHSEHGWDIHDPDGTNRKYRAMRRLASPMINRFVTVSRELEQWLATTVGIPPAKIKRICNGVDTEKFRPAAPGEQSILPPSIFPPGSVAIVSVTRFSPIKDPLNLVRAFIQARRDPAGANLRLAMIGDGPQHPEALRALAEAGVTSDCWMPGARDDIAPILRGASVFVLGSLREGISNTVLESMATGLPVVATRTGGNIELVKDGLTGRLVAPGDSSELAATLLAYAREPNMRIAHGLSARELMNQEYSLRRMLAEYDALYRGHSAQYGEAA